MARDPTPSGRERAGRRRGARPSPRRPAPPGAGLGRAPPGPRPGAGRARRPGTRGPPRRARRPSLAGGAHDAPGRGREAAEVLAGPAGGAGRELGGEPGGQEQLQAEGQLIGPPRAGHVGVQEGELVAEEVEDLRVRLAGLEEAGHRVAGAGRGVEGRPVRAQTREAVDGLRARDRQEVRATLVQDEARRKNGSRRPPKRLRVRRTPFAMALTRPRCGV